MLWAKEELITHQGLFRILWVLLYFERGNARASALYSDQRIVNIKPQVHSPRLIHKLDGGKAPFPGGEIASTAGTFFITEGPSQAPVCSHQRDQTKERRGDSAMKYFVSTQSRIY